MSLYSATTTCRLSAIQYAGVMSSLNLLYAIEIVQRSGAIRQISLTQLSTHNHGDVTYAITIGVAPFQRVEINPHYFVSSVMYFCEQKIQQVRVSQADVDAMIAEDDDTPSAATLHED